MAKSCCMCGEVFLQGETFQLTDEEIAVLGPNGARELNYCSECLKASRNIQQGSSIMSGLFERALRASGVRGAKEAAAKFKQKLVSAATRKFQ